MTIVDHHEPFKESPAEPAFFSLQVAEARRFFLDLEPQDGVPLQVISGGCEHAAPGYEVSRDDFPYLGLEFVARGSGRLQLGGASHRITPGVAFSYGPGVPHHITGDQEHGLVKYFVDISGDLAEERMAESGLAPGQVVQITAPGDIIHLFDELIRAGLRNTLRTPRICTLVAEQLLLRAAELAVDPGAANTPAFSTFQRCREYLEEHALELRTLGDISDACNIDPAYLCRLFARFDDLSPYQLLLRLKMNHAAERLATSDAMIKEIAADLGYSDPFHFSRTFKKVHGIAPEQFARRRPS